MANYCVTNGNLFDGTPKTLVVNGGATLHVQASGNASYNVKGRLTSNGNDVVLSGINATDYSIADTITDTGIYTYDVAGYYSVTVDGTVGSGIKIFGTIFAD